jgi:TDG/mug DNA glycosylase family protein
VLILGSMPGAESLRRQEYYAHPQNQFWPIMGQLFGAGREVPYAERVAMLLERGVAVWDVLKHCEREGSLDSAIVRGSEAINDFARFFEEHPHLRAVFFNGAKSESLFKAHVRPLLGARLGALSFERLPSTSPTSASVPPAAKARAWHHVKEHVTEPARKRA